MSVITFFTDSGSPTTAPMGGRTPSGLSGSVKSSPTFFKILIVLKTASLIRTRSMTVTRNSTRAPFFPTGALAVFRNSSHILLIVGWFKYSPSPSNWAKLRINVGATPAL